MGKEPSPFSCVWLPEIWCSKLSFLRAEQGAHPGLTHLPSSARRALTAKTRDEKFSSDCRPLELNLNRTRSKGACRKVAYSSSMYSWLIVFKNNDALRTSEKVLYIQFAFCP